MRLMSVQSRIICITGCGFLDVRSEASLLSRQERFSRMNWHSDSQENQLTESHIMQKYVIDSIPFHAAFRRRYHIKCSVFSNHSDGWRCITRLAFWQPHFRYTYDGLLHGIHLNGIKYPDIMQEVSHFNSECQANAN